MKRIRLTENQLYRLIEQALNDQKFEPNDSRKRVSRTRYAGSTTKDMPLNNERYRTSYVNDDDYNYNEKYFDDKFGEGDECMHGKPTGRKAHNSNESIARRVMEGVIRQALNEYDERDDWDDEDYDEEETTENVKGETIGKYKIDTKNNIVFVSDSLENPDYNNIVECLGKLIVYTFSDAVGFDSDRSKIETDDRGVFFLNQRYSIQFPNEWPILIYMGLAGDLERLSIGYSYKIRLQQGYCKPLKVRSAEIKAGEFFKSHFDWQQLEKYVEDNTQWGGY